MSMKDDLYINTLFGFTDSKLKKMPNTTVNWMDERSTSLTHHTRIGDIKVDWGWNDVYSRYVIRLGTVDLNGKCVDVNDLPGITPYKNGNYFTSASFGKYILSITKNK